MGMDSEIDEALNHYRDVQDRTTARANRLANVFVRLSRDNAELFEMIMALVPHLHESVGDQLATQAKTVARGYDELVDVSKMYIKDLADEAEAAEGFLLFIAERSTEENWDKSDFKLLLGKHRRDS